MRLQARIARLEAAAPKPARDPAIELREDGEQLVLRLKRMQAEWRRREALPLEEQLALERQDLAQMRFKRNAPIALSGEQPGGLFERWAEQSVRLLEIRILEHEGLDADTARELRENAYAFVRFGQPLVSLPRPVAAADATDQLREKTMTP